MKSSVILSTYNGQENIIEQLDSIKNQVMSPDEVLIFDDASTDHTADMVKKYILQNSLSNWFLYKNEDNLGWRRNFIYGMDKASGEYIFPCDQDDVWDKAKLYNMIAVMDENEYIDLLASTYTEWLFGGGEANMLKRNTLAIVGFQNTRIN